MPFQIPKGGRVSLIHLLQWIKGPVDIQPPVDRTQHSGSSLYGQRGSVAWSALLPAYPEHDFSCRAKRSNQHKTQGNGHVLGQETLLVFEMILRYWKIQPSWQEAYCVQADPSTSVDSSILQLLRHPSRVEKAIKPSRFLKSMPR